MKCGKRCRLHESFRRTCRSTCCTLVYLMKPRYLLVLLYRKRLVVSHSGCIKVIYVARNPKDVIVSYFYLYKLYKIVHDYRGNLEQFADFFMNDEGPLTKSLVNLLKIICLEVFRFFFCNVLFELQFFTLRISPTSWMPGQSVRIQIYSFSFTKTEKRYVRVVNLPRLRLTNCRFLGFTGGN